MNTTAKVASGLGLAAVVAGAVVFSSSGRDRPRDAGTVGTVDAGAREIFDCKSIGLVRCESGALAGLCAELCE